MAKKKGKAGKAGGGRRGRQQLPQPPVPPVQGPAGQPGYYEYAPTTESQLNQPYQDVEAAGALQGLGGVLGRMPQQGQMGDIYGMTSAGSLGQYGQLMGPNLGIQQQLAQRIADIQAGKLDVDPMLVQQLGDQERVLHEQLRRNLGPDAANSSAGIEALSKFNQFRNNTLASANFNQLQNLIGMQQGGMQNIAGAGQNFGALYGQNAMDLYNQAMGLRAGQLGGAGQMLGQLGQIQNLYGNIPQTMGEFGQAMSGQAGAAVNAQDPYQRDRMAQLQASYAPTSADYSGQMLREQGNRLISSASAMGGGGPSAPQMPDYPQSAQQPGGWPMGPY